MITYHEPNEQQKQIVKKLFEYQQKINTTESINEIEQIVHNIYDLILNVPTATYTNQIGIVKDFSYAKENFSQVLIADLNSYSDIQNMKVGIILTLDLLMSTFVVGREKLIKILKASLGSL